MNNTINRPGGGARAWIIFALVVATIVAVQCYSLRYSPTIWQDEVQILDFGRTLMPGADRSHAMSWLDSGRPHDCINYVGCVIQEIACRLAGDDPLGPRLSSLLAACLAAAATVAWLMQSGVRPWVASCSGLIFLLTPIFALSYRGGRVDSWAIAFMMLACWAAGKARHEARGKRQEVRGAGLEALGERREGGEVGDGSPNLHFSNFDLRTVSCYALAGVFLGLAGMAWVSAIVLVPLVLGELLRRRAGQNSSARDVLAGAAVTGFVAMLVSVLCLVPVWTHLPDMLQDLGDKSRAELTLSSAVTTIFRAMRAFMMNPLLPLLGVAGIVLSRKWWLLVALTGGLALVVYTSEGYTHRSVYLVPYFVAGLAFGAEAALSRWHDCKTGFAVAGLIGLCLLWSAALTLGGRTLAAYAGSAERDPKVILDMARENIGAGPHKVYVWNWEFGYAARKLGWKFTKRFRWESLKDQAFLAMLGNVDHVVVGSDISAAGSEQLAQLGFTKVQKASPPAGCSAGQRAPWQGTARYRDFLFHSRPEASLE